ncbi:MAG: hypothetical protein JW943_14635 [Deltaproteobacteria bacterium]|nr:hypothetical protein [Deltaproteobacteria bacterium]
MSENNFIIGIASQQYDIDGAFIVSPSPESTSLRGGQRRITRTKTLDGGVVITDGGLSDGDRTLEIRIPMTRDLWLLLWALFSSAMWITVSTDEGCFLAKIETMTKAGAEIALTILVKEDLTI